MRYAAGHDVPFHQHPYTQGHPAGAFDGESGPGDSYVVRGSTDHAITGLEPDAVVDAFTPPREDHL